MYRLVFPIMMTLLVVGIILCKDSSVAFKGISKTTKNILFLLEPFIFGIFVLSWARFYNISAITATLISIVVGLLLFISLTALFTEPKKSSKAYPPEELIGKFVQIRMKGDTESRYLGQIIGDGVDIVITSDEKLEKNDFVKIIKIDDGNIIGEKVE